MQRLLNGCRVVDNTMSSSNELTGYDPDELNLHGEAPTELLKQSENKDGVYTLYMKTLRFYRF